MKLIKINPHKPEMDKIEQAIEVLENEGTVVYPTDTIYGLGANIFSENAIKKVYSLKRRSLNKPLSVCVSGIEVIHKIAHLDKKGEQLVNEIFPGPFTVILRKKEHISSILTAGGEKIGIRIPNSRICHQLARKFPITTTSANLSGGEAPESADDVVKELGDSVDLILDAGKSENKIPSTVIDLTLKPPKILRKGVVVALNMNESQ